MPPSDVLAKLRAPFPAEQIGKLPKSTCQDCSKAQFKRCDKHQWVTGCKECHGNHTSATIHLDYVGHADVCARLLEVDPEWNWEPMALDEVGLPCLDRGGNLWIRLTVAGVSRLGVGDGASAKVCIGDAIRNAAMRFGVALDLWAKGDRSWAHDETPEPKPDPVADGVTKPLDYPNPPVLLQEIRDLAGNRAKQEMVAIKWHEQHGYLLKDATDIPELTALRDELRSVRAS